MLTSAQYQPVNRPPVFNENMKKNFSIRYILSRKIYLKDGRGKFSQRVPHKENVEVELKRAREKNYCGRLHIERPMTEHGRDFSRLFEREGECEWKLLNLDGKLQAF